MGGKRITRGLSEFHVYALLDTRKPGYFRYGRWVFHHEPFYIGKGLGRRHLAHEKEALNTASKSIKSRIVRKILVETGGPPKIVIKKRGLSESNAFALERELILRIGRRNIGLGPLSNLTDGGEGHHGIVHSRRVGQRKRETYESKTPAEKQRIKEKISTSWSSKTPKELERIREKKQRSWAGKSESAKKALSKKLRKVMASEEFKARRKKTLMKTLRNRPESVVESWKVKLKAAIAKRTPEHWAIIAEKKRKTRESHGEAWKEDLLKRIGRNSKKNWENRSPDEKKAISRKLWETRCKNLG